MRNMKFGAWTVMVAFVSLAVACDDSGTGPGGEPDDGDDGALEIAEERSAIRSIAGPWGPGPGGILDPIRDNDPWSSGPWNKNPWDKDPWDNDPWDNDPWDNDPWDNDPWDNDPWDPWDDDPWPGSGLGGYGHLVTRKHVIPGNLAGGIQGLTTIAWVSPYRGGIGGVDYSVTCEAGEIVTGIYGRYSSFVDQIGLFCAPVDATGALGVEILRGYVGGTGGEEFVSKCPVGYGVAGFVGRSGLYVHQLQVVCDTVPGTTLFYGPMFGGVGGDPWTDISPGRYFLTSLSGRSDTIIDAVQAIYRYVAF